MDQFHHHHQHAQHRTIPDERVRTRRFRSAPAQNGDFLVPHGQFRATRAITINASPESVWPRLVQVGCLRAGLYSNDLLDNLAHPSADRVIPELQDLEVGQWVAMSPTPTERRAGPNRSRSQEEFA